MIVAEQKPMDEIIAIISTPKIIDKEWRIVVADGQFLSASQYKSEGKLEMKSGCDEGAMELAAEIAKEEWQPDPICVLDICLSGGKYHLLEANSFSCAGLYKCPVGVIVSEASRLAIREWQEYNDI